MKRYFSLILAFVFLVCTMIPSVEAASVENTFSAEWFSHDYDIVYFAPRFSQQNDTRSAYSFTGELAPGQMGFLGPYTFDTISMSIEYTPTSEEIAYGITTDPNTLSRLDFRVATGGSGSATLYPGLRTYYILVANKSDTTMQFTLTYLPTATVK